MRRVRRGGASTSVWLAVSVVTIATIVPACTPDARPRITALSGPSSVARYDRFETSAAISPDPANPFDPAQIDVQGVFVDPAGRTWHATGFWYQGYSRALVNDREVLTPVGPPGWKVRFAPTTTGRWRWWWTVTTPAGSTQSVTRVVDVVPGDNPGFIRRTAADSRYLVHDDGSSYFAVGENTGWYDQRGTFAYDSWYGRLAEQGANFSRLWMPSWAFGIEWTDTGLGDYRKRLDRAWQLDRVIEEGERRGIYTMLSLLNHGAFSKRSTASGRATRTTRPTVVRSPLRAISSATPPQPRSSSAVCATSWLVGATPPMCTHGNCGTKPTSPGGPTLPTRLPGTARWPATCAASTRRDTS